MSSIEQTGRTVEEAVKTALKVLGVSREEVEVEVLSQESRGLLGILGYSEAKVRVTPLPGASAPSSGEEDDEFAVAEPPVAELDAEPALRSSRAAQSEAEWTGEPGPVALRAQEVLAEILRLMDLSARAEITREDEEGIYLAVRDEDDLGLLIGRQGHTLAALQTLVATIANHPFPAEERRRIIVDAAEYRARREASLVTMAQNAAQKAKRSGREIPLQALTPRERRLVHVTLADTPGVTTRSEGEDPERFVVVVPTGPPEPGEDRPRTGGPGGRGPSRGSRSGPRRRY